MRTYKSSAIAGNSPDKELNYGISQTVPDQSLTVREILTKFANGTLPDIYEEPEFTEDLPDLRGLDISQVHEMNRENKQKIEELDKTDKKEKAEKARIKKEKDDADRRQAIIDEHEKTKK